MNSLNKDIGALGEDKAAEYLKKNGYSIITRNFRCKVGEIDIIARSENYIVFIEVKARYNTAYGAPMEAITYGKKLKLYRTAEMFLLKNKTTLFNFRFDVVEVLFNNENDNFSVKIIKDAFQL